MNERSYNPPPDSIRLQLYNPSNPFHTFGFYMYVRSRMRSVSFSEIYNRVEKEIYSGFRGGGGGNISISTVNMMITVIYTPRMIDFVSQLYGHTFTNQQRLVKL